MKFGKIHYTLTAALGEMRSGTGRDRNEAGGWRGLDRFVAAAQKQSAPKNNRRRSHPGMAPPPNSRTGNRSCGGARSAAEGRCHWNSSRGSDRHSVRSASWEQCVFGTIHHADHDAPDGSDRQVCSTYNLVVRISGRWGGRLAPADAEHPQLDQRAPGSATRINSTVCAHPLRKACHRKFLLFKGVFTELNPLGINFLPTM